MKFSLHSNPLLEKLDSSHCLLLYSMGGFATPRHVDFISRSGYFDAIWIDLEHFEIPLQDVTVLAMIARAAGVATVARFKATGYDGVMRVLETGVDAIMCAMVEDAAEARRIVEWSKFYDPAGGYSVGRRGWNAGNVDAAYGNIAAPEYLRHQNSQTLILCQIEYPAALDQAAAIAGVHGVDALFFGPGDYSASLGMPGEIDHPVVDEAMGKVADAVRDVGKWWGTVSAGRQALYRRARDLGARMVCPGGDVRVMNLGLRALVASFEVNA